MNHQSPVDFFHSLSLQYDRPVLFTEAGYRSLDGTNIRPGGWNVTAPRTCRNSATRSRRSSTCGARKEAGSAARISGVGPSNAYSPTGYSPMDKPAEQLITEWFAGQHQATSRTVDGSPDADLIDVGGGNDRPVRRPRRRHDSRRRRQRHHQRRPGSHSAPATTTVTVTGFSPVVDGVGARMQLLVNGQPVGDVVEFRGASTPADYQTFTFTFDNPATVEKPGFRLHQRYPHRGRRPQPLYQGHHRQRRASERSRRRQYRPPGTWNLYHNRSIDYDMHDRQALFFGAPTDNDVIDGGRGQRHDHCRRRQRHRAGRSGKGPRQRRQW